MYNFGNFHLRKFARTVCHSHNVYNPFCVPRKSCYFDNLPLLSNFIKAQRLLTWSLNYGSTYIRHCLKFQFARLRDTPAMTLKPLLANENEIAMKEKQWKAFPFRFCETSYILTDTKGVYKQRYYQEIFKTRVSNYYLLWSYCVGLQSFIRICTEVQFLLKFEAKKAICAHKRSKFMATLKIRS